MSREISRPRWKVVLVLSAIALLVIAGLLTYYVWHKEHLKPKIQTSRVTSQTMQRVVISSGDVRPVDRQLIYANSLTAPVQKLDVQVGSRVKKGQPLLQLDTSSAQLAVAQAQSTLTQAKLAYTRALQGYNAAPSALQALWLPQVDSTQSAVVQAEQQLATAQVQLRAATITANFAGTVIVASMNGLDASGNQVPIIELVGESKQVVLELSEVDAIHVQKGMSVSMTTEAVPNETFHGRVSLVAPFADTSTSGTPQIQVLVTPVNSLSIPLGYQMNCKITSATHKAVPTVPYSALVQQGTNYGVFTVSNDRVKLTMVQLGITNNTSVEVTSGLNAGQVIVDNPPATLTSGEAVTIR